METKIKWQEGEGYITATYNGSGNGSASITSDINEGIDREQPIKVEATDNSTSVTVMVSQEGLREIFEPSESEFILADGDTFNVLKTSGEQPEEPDTSIDVNNYLTIEALADGLTVKLATSDVEYCVDGDGKWNVLAADTATVTVNTGQTLSFRANYTAYNTSRRFTISKSCNVLGDPMSLYYGDNAKDYRALPYSYSFAYLFYNCTAIVDATRLILDRTLKTYAYAYMFYGCSNLLYPPELPATTLSTSCYRYMFRNCSNLLKSPILPALKLPAYCYEYMFTACSDLAEITMLATDKSGSNCMLGWVSKVKSKGTFYKNKDATWTTTGVSGVPSGWTVILI